MTQDEQRALDDQHELSARVSARESKILGTPTVGTADVVDCNDPTQAAEAAEVFRKELLSRYQSMIAKMLVAHPELIADFNLHVEYAAAVDNARRRNR